MIKNANLDIVRAPAASMNPIAWAPKPRKIRAKKGIEIFRTSIMEKIFVMGVVVPIAWQQQVWLWARGIASRFYMLVSCSGIISSDGDRLAGRYQKPAQPVGRQANHQQSPISRHC